MTKFRPCIDLHGGRVKQIVGGSLTDDGKGLLTNFESSLPPAHYAQMYRGDALKGGHIIMLGAGNELAAREALAAWPGGMQVGGGIHGDNAADWLEAGASHVIVTSWLFSPEGKFLWHRLRGLVQEIGSERLVLDLSCRKMPEGGWRVYMNRWQTPTDLEVDGDVLASLTEYCDEFLIHAADVEGKRAGMDEELIEALADWCTIPVTYAGGAASLDDLELADTLSYGKVDLTIGSALDIFGGSLPYAQCVAWNRQ
jgi:phosphoribosylformimino-5-aminoimidazole carboxamide ribotide isomerase